MTIQKSIEIQMKTKEHVWKSEKQRNIHENQTKAMTNYEKQSKRMNI